MVVKLVKPLPVKPARGYLLCEELAEPVSKAGLVLPDNVNTDSYRPKKLRVLAVGGDKIVNGMTIPCQSKVGDVVIPGGPGFKWDFDGESLWLLDSDLVICKVVYDAE